MSKYFLIAGNLALLAGVFANKTDLQAAAKQDPDAVVVTNPNDIHEALSEPQMRRIRADIAARTAKAEDPESEGRRLFQSDPRFNTKGKKMATAQKLYDELMEFAGSPVAQDLRVAKSDQPTAAKVPRAPRRNIKKHIRELFPNVGDEKTLATIAAANPDDPSQLYSDVSITTALSDLRSEKYAGEGGPINIKRKKAEDGTISFVREA